MLKKLLAVALCATAFPLHAQVEIVESRPFGQAAQPTTGPGSEQALPTMDAKLQSEMYFQMQMLQQEVQELRGLVEEQSFELKRLKQQRLDDYLDLDRRLSQLGSATSNTTAHATTQQNTKSSGSTTAPTASVAPEVDELASYRAAIDLVLKKRDFDGGATALQEYLGQFPSGHYAANAQYWLGQIYFQKQDYEQSKKWFGQMIEQFPQHQKAFEAKFKLAKVHHHLGDNVKAKSLAEEVASSDSSAASLAKDFLKSLN